MKLDNIRKIHLVGDLHFGIRNNSTEWLNISKEFLLDFLISKVDEDFDENSDILIFEGDLFHSRESVNIRIQNEVFDIFRELSQKFKRGVYAIVGNHDTYYKDTNDVHSLRALSHLAENIFIFDSPEILTINGIHNFLLLPWIDDVDKMTSVVKDNAHFCQYMICHADIKGFKLNRWADIERGLDPISISNFKRIYGGHIHLRQEKNNVLYTGSPYQMDRSDIGNSKGYYQLTVKPEGISEKFIKNTKSPIFVKFEVFDLLEMTPSQVKDLFSNNFVDVQVNINFINRLQIPQFLQLLAGCKTRRLDFFTYSDSKPVLTSDEVSIKNDDDLSINSIFKKYAKSRNYSTELLDKLTKKFEKLQEDAKNEKNYA